MEQERDVAIGDVVVWHDPKGNAYNALVTTVWSKTMLNLVMVSNDENQKDGYGRQIQRQASAPHKRVTNVHGFYWRFVDEEPNPYVAPLAS